MSAPANPYSLAVYDLIHQPGHHREVRLEFPAPEKLGEGLVSVPAGQAMEIDVTLESIHDGIVVSGEVDTVATGVCGRCLIDIEQPVQVEFQELFAYPSDEAFDFEIHDDHVDLEPLVRDSVVLSLPFQPVCRPDCPGLDPETGERLADHPEFITPREPTDPRWAALGELKLSETETEES
ncbi:YceD family protein [Gryllotalpicola sp.]|uniref:YceD family protein n=1 Tax=Gryllotalpicola sp. TaxID=1932787 RepID=UPI00260B13EB|nr:YceD family protein [Gryllotalpicola sp.]